MQMCLDCATRAVVEIVLCSVFGSGAQRTVGEPRCNSFMWRCGDNGLDAALPPALSLRLLLPDILRIYL